MNWARQENSTNRVLRGGAWNNTTTELRCARRNNNNPTNANNNIGVRCVRRIRERITALQAERARSRSRAAADPKAHLPPPVSRGDARNEHGQRAGTGSHARTSRRCDVARAVCLLVLALCAAARANFAESPVFVFDTRDSNSTHYADSAAFALDTRSSNSTHYNESGVFAFDTRAFDGLGGSGRSGTFVLDTRATLADGLTLVGPASVTTGSTTEYRVAFRSGNTTADVTTQCTLAFVGAAPTWAGVGGTTLFVNRNAPASTVTLRAIWRPPGGGQSLSAPKTVAVGNILRAGMTAAPLPVSGPNYTVNLSGTAAGGLPFYTFRWDTNGDGIYGDKTGSIANFALVDAVGGYHAVNLEVIDGNGNKAYAKGGVTIDRAPVVNEPVRTTPTPVVGSGTAYDRAGNPFQFSPSRKANGVIVVTHGLYSQALGTGGKISWMQDMATRIDTRLTANGNPPNIVLYDWSEFNDPGGQVPAWKLKALQLLSYAQSGTGLYNAAKLGLDEAKKVAAEIIVEEALSIPSEEYTGIPLDWSGAALLGDRMIDAIAIRVIARSQGQVLASWIRRCVQDELIDPSRPIHLIGDGAGGFLVGECALLLKNPPVETDEAIPVDRTTMLDTAFPIRSHFKTLPDPNYVERIIGSHLGGLEFPSTYFVMPGTYLRMDTLGDNFWARLLPGSHELTQRWYRRTILPQGEADGEELDAFGDPGFSLSPFLSGPMVPRESASLNSVRRSKGAAIAPAGGSNIIGFTAFGNVTETSGTYTITEASNAGLTRPLTMPVGAEALKFRFHFSAAGDGDFFEVRFGDDQPLYVALDTELSRAGFVEVEAPIDGLDGMTKLLTFTLVSRGAVNAVVQVSDICLVTTEDPDGDGLTTSQETVLGTNPLVADSDGDGLSDSAEVTAGTSALLWDTDGDGLGDGAEFSAGTNPLDASSTFLVKQTTLNPDRTITIVWEAQAGRTYRVLRSLEPDFPEFDVIASAIVPVVPLTSFTDTAIDAATTEKVFYRVQVE